MEQGTFEQAVLAVLQQVPGQHRESILTVVQALVRELLEESQAAVEKRQFSVERHRDIRSLTAAVGGSLAAAVSAEREERG